MEPAEVARLYCSCLLSDGGDIMHLFWVRKKDVFMRFVDHLEKENRSNWY